MVAVLGLSGLIRGDSPVTTIVPFAEANLSVKLTVCFWPSPEETEGFVCGSKPAASALTV